MADVVRYEQMLGPISVGLRKDLHVSRQRTRGGPRYLVHDPVTFHNHAFNRVDYRILSAIVPKRTLFEVFQDLVGEGVLAPDDKGGFYEFVLWLHGAGLLQLPISRSDLLFERYERKRSARRASLLSAVLSCKIKVFDPDAFLQRTLRYVGWLFSRTGVLLWMLLMAVVVWKCTGRFGELLSQTTGLLTLANLPVLWLALVVLKVLHEFGHAFACRKFGGAVPEMGIVFIVMTPCAYVDANASWKFDSAWRRVAVALSGMYIESIVAGIFALVWAGTQPGFVHDLALNVVVLASVVTVFLNLNPLMRFDGYYVFSDLTGVMNLQERAFKFLKSWASQVVLGQPRPAPVRNRGERWLYVLYGPCAFAYRVALAFFITSCWSCSTGRPRAWCWARSSFGCWFSVRWCACSATCGCRTTRAAFAPARAWWRRALWRACRCWWRSCRFRPAWWRPVSSIRGREARSGPPRVASCKRCSRTTVVK